MQLALINLDSNSSVDDGFVFADCRRNITSGLMQVASFMLTARNIVIVMSWRLLISCISVAAACIYLHLNKLLCISCIRLSDRVDCFECLQKYKTNFPIKRCTWITYVTSVKDLHYANDLQGFSRSLEWRVVTMCLSRAISLTLSLLRCKWLPVARLTPKSLSFWKKTIAIKDHR